MNALIQWLLKRGHVVAAVERQIRVDERERCKHHARKWIGDPDAAINVDTYIQRGREADEAGK